MLLVTESTGPLHSQAPSTDSAAMPPEQLSPMKPKNDPSARERQPGQHQSSSTSPVYSKQEFLPAFRGPGGRDKRAFVLLSVPRAIRSEFHRERPPDCSHLLRPSFTRMPRTSAKGYFRAPRGHSEKMGESGQHAART